MMIRTMLLFLFNSLLAIQLIASDSTKPDSITVASLSIFPEKWDKEGNTAKITKMVREAAAAGADLVACPAYGSWGDRNDAVMMTRAFENQVNVVFSHPNQSLIIDNDGEIVGECEKDSFVIRKISVAKVENRRPTVKYRRPDSYDALSKQKANLNP